MIYRGGWGTMTGKNAIGWHISYKNSLFDASSNLNVLIKSYFKKSDLFSFLESLNVKIFRCLLKTAPLKRLSMYE
jgi:hypothetical protein